MVQLFFLITMIRKSFVYSRNNVSKIAQEAVFQKQHRKQAEHRAAPKITKKSNQVGLECEFNHGITNS
jgi:hypothetical protein